MVDNQSVTYTHGHSESVLRSHRWRTVGNSAAQLLPHLTPGVSVLDVGSGPGTISVDIARRIAPGRLTALEVSDQVLDLTRAEASRQGQDNLDFQVGDVTDLPFDDATFDVVHAHQVLQHLGDPVGALQEMRRVCKPGGVVTARDGDYGGFIWYPADPRLDEWRRLYRAAAYANGGEPDAGRHLLAWAQQAGFSEIAAAASVWCFCTPDDRGWWGGMWADRILKSDLAGQLLRTGAATEAQLQDISDAWQAWAAAPDGWISILHGVIVARP